MTALGRFLRRNAAALAAHAVTLAVGFLLGAGATVADLILRAAG